MEIKTMKTTPAIIDFNFEEIKNNLIEYSKKYVGLIVTEENEKEMVVVKNELSKLEKTIDKKNKEHLLDLKISNFMNLIEKTATEIIEEIDKVVNSELQKIEKINNEKQEEIKITEKELKKTYLITIRNIDKTDIEKIKNELNDEFYDFEIKEI